MSSYNSIFTTPLKNPSLASTAQNFNFSKTFTNANLPTISHFPEQNGVNSRFNSLENLSMMEDEPHQNEMKEHGLMVLMQKTICYLANKYNVQSRRMRQLSHLVERKERDNNIKQKRLKAQKKIVLDKLKKKKKQKEKIKRLKEQEKANLQEEIESLHYQSSLLDKQIQSLIPQKKRSNHHNSQQPIIIVVPSSYPPPHQPIYQPPNPEKQQFYQPTYPVPPNQPNIIQHSSTNPMHHLMKVTPPRQEVKKGQQMGGNILMGENFGQMIAKGMMQQQQMGSRNVSQKTSEKSSTKLKITAKEINLFKKESRNKLKASGKWDVDEDDSNLNEALSQSLGKSASIQRTKTTPAIAKPNILQSDVVIDVEESIAKNSLLSPDRNRHKFELKESAVRLSLPQDDLSREVSNKSSSQEIKQITTKKIQPSSTQKIESPVVIRKIDSSIEEEVNRSKFKKKTDSSIIELDIPDMEVSNVGIKYDSPTQKNHQRKVSKEMKESKTPKKNEKSQILDENDFILDPNSVIKKSQLPPHPPPKEQKKSSKVGVKPDEYYQSVQIETKKSLVSGKSSINRSQGGNQKTPRHSESDTSFDEELGNINLLAISKVSKNKNESYISLKSKIRESGKNQQEIANQEKQLQNRHSYPLK